MANIMPKELIRTRPGEPLRPPTAQELEAEDTAAALKHANIVKALQHQYNADRLTMPPAALAEKYQGILGQRDQGPTPALDNTFGKQPY